MKCLQTEPLSRTPLFRNPSWNLEPSLSWTEPFNTSIEPKLTSLFQTNTYFVPLLNPVFLISQEFGPISFSPWGSKWTGFHEIWFNLQALNNCLISEMCLKVAVLKCHTVGFPLYIQRNKASQQVTRLTLTCARAFFSFFFSAWSQVSFTPPKPTQPSELY